MYMYTKKDGDTGAFILYIHVPQHPILARAALISTHCVL